MNRWIVGAFLLICVVVAASFLLRPKDECDYLTHARKAGVDFGVTVEHVTSVKGTLGLTDSDVAVLDQFRRDYGEKFRNICADHKAGRIDNDQYNCRRENMDKVLDQFRLLNTISNAKDKGQAEQALNAIRQFASSGGGPGCQPAARLMVNPNQLDFPDDGISIFTQVTNLGKKDAHYSFDQLPLAFLPTPSAGSIGSGQMISIVFVRTKYPMPQKEINFFLSDDFNEQIAMRIKVNPKSAAIYDKLGAELAENSLIQPTLADAMKFVETKWPSLQNKAARYLIAANILDSIGNENEASHAITLASNADKSLETNSGAQFTLAVLKTKAGEKQEAYHALLNATKFAPPTDTDAISYLTGMSNLKFGQWNTASKVLCTTSTKDWAREQEPWVVEGAKEFEMPAVASAVTSLHCRKDVLELALQRYTANDPEYSHIMAEIRKESNH